MAKATHTEETAPETNKPVAQTVIEETADTTPKVTGQKANIGDLKGRETVNLRSMETGYVHENLPAATAERLIRKNPNGFEIVK